MLRLSDQLLKCFIKWFSLSSALFRLTTWLNIFAKDGRQSTLEYMMVAFCFYMIEIDAKALISYKYWLEKPLLLKLTNSLYKTHVYRHTL